MRVTYHRFYMRCITLVHSHNEVITLHFLHQTWGGGKALPLDSGDSVTDWTVGAEQLDSGVTLLMEHTFDWAAEAESLATHADWSWIFSSSICLRRDSFSLRSSLFKWKVCSRVFCNCKLDWLSFIWLVCHLWFDVIRMLLASLRRSTSLL